MVDHFKKLFSYDSHSTLALINVMQSTGLTTGKPIELMAHLLAAQQIWLLRCKSLPAPGSSLWPNQTVQEMVGITGENYSDWMDYLDSLQPGDLEKAVTYHNTRGDEFTNTLSDILAHVINHGTHHRAQIGQLLKFKGADQLPATDYIFYIRQQ